MKKYFFRNLFLITFFMLLCFSSIAQVRQQVSTEYDRNSLTILLLDAQEKYTSQLKTLMDSLKIPEKFFDNTLEKKSVPISIDRAAIAAKDSYRMLVSLPSIEGALTNAKIPQLLLSRWFDREEDGSFGVKTLAESGGLQRYRQRSACSNRQ
jgi:hypothetical protein